MVSSLSSGRRIVKKLDARGKTLFGPFPFSVTNQGVDLIGIAEVLLFDLPLTLEEPCVGMLDTCHGLEQVTTDGGTDVMDQRLVIKRRLSIDGKSAAPFLQEIDQLLGADI
jgi:hypothetical protein